MLFPLRSSTVLLVCLTACLGLSQDSIDRSTLPGIVVDNEEAELAEQQELAQKQAKEKPRIVKRKAVPQTLEFKKVPAPTNLTKLTPEQLDSRMECHLGSILMDQFIDDTDFLRRVSLDIIGRQPTPGELAAFLADQAFSKRERIIQRLLAADEYGKNWANYWSDVISYRVPEPELTFLNYVPLKQWLAERLNENITWDEVVFELLTASGIIGDRPEATFVGFHQAEKSRLAAESARIFLGINIQCAECHDHPFVDMPQKTFHQMAAFFVRTEAQLPWNDSSAIEVKSKPKGEHKLPGTDEQMQPVAFNSKSVKIGAGDLSRRTELAHWVVSPDNPWFARAYTNHIWARLMGRGFSDPVDDIGEGTDLVLPDVHAAVAEHFAATGYDTKALLRLIVNSKFYARASRPVVGTDPDKPFATSIAKRLRGDEVFDSLVTAIGLPDIRPSAAEATDAIRFPPPPKSTRDLTNEAYGFDPSLKSDYVVRTMKQAMFMMNNEQIQKQIDASSGSGTVLSKLLESQNDDKLAVNALYEIVLARAPKRREFEIALKHIQRVPDRGAGFEDLLWSLLNSAEFTTRR